MGKLILISRTNILNGIVNYFLYSSTSSQKMSKITINFFFVPETSNTPPLPLQSSPRSARTGPIKTGGQVFVLDHKRWTSSMKEAIDGLLDNYHGQKDMLKLVDQDYAAIVRRSATDPNSLLHPTTKYHITQYIKHLAKQVNTSSLLNTMQKNFWRHKNCGKV